MASARKQCQGNIQPSVSPRSRSVWLTRRWLQPSGPRAAIHPEAVTSPAIALRGRGAGFCAALLALAGLDSVLRDAFRSKRLGACFGPHRGEGSSMRVRSGCLRFGVGLVLVAVGVLGAAASASAEAVSFTGQECRTWEVPVGASGVGIRAVGQVGQPGEGAPEYGVRTTHGGAGDAVSATLSVSAKELLDVCVDEGAGAGATAGPSNEYSGSGGGASGVGVGSGFSAPALVAGGGGGGGACLLLHRPWRQRRCRRSRRGSGREPRSTRTRCEWGRRRHGGRSALHILRPG